jgi:Tfp pilus assembly protein PilF
MNMLKYLAFLVSLLFIFAACSTTPKKESVPEKSTEESPEDYSDPPSEDGDEEVSASDEEDADSKAKKAKKDKKEIAYFDGNTYRGPALKEFMDGLGNYFSDGCEKAVQTWKSALGKDRKRPEIAFNIGLCYERIKDYPKMKEWYERSFNIDRNFLKPLYNYSLAMGDRLPKEKDYLVKLVEKTEDAVEKNNFLAWLYFNLNDLSLSEKHAKMVLKEDEQNVDAVVSLAAIYRRNGMLELADMALSTAEQWDENNFRLQRLYGFLAYDMGRKGKATEHFRKAVRINPELPEVRTMLAVLAMEIEDYNTAKDHLEFALRINPEFIAAKINLAIAYKGLGKYKESRDILTELEKKQDLPVKTVSTIIFNLGILYLDADVDGDRQVERFDKAVDYFNKHLALIKKESNFRQQKALIDEYIKEANNEKKRLELFIRTQERMRARQKAAEEEHKLFLKNKEDAFKKAVEQDNLEAWKEYLKSFPVLGPDDKFSNAAKGRLDELLKEAGIEEVAPEGSSDENEVKENNSEIE